MNESDVVEVRIIFICPKSKEKASVRLDGIELHSNRETHVKQSSNGEIWAHVDCPLCGEEHELVLKSW